jgi:ABC-type glutathione transport system ATPase component
MILEARNLSRSYRLRGATPLGRREEIMAVQNVNLGIARGQTVGIVGESGSGKTTLARMLAGLIRPTSGVVLFNSEPIWDQSADEWRTFRKTVQIVFQNPYASFDPRLKVGNSLLEPLRSLGSNEDPEVRVSDVLSMVGLDPRMKSRYPHEFSGGQRQRLAIARALCPKPRLLILDEPLSALDVSIQAQILNLLQDLRAVLHLTLILVSHDLHVIRNTTDFTAVMFRGSLVEADSTESVFEDPQHDHTRDLINASLNLV